MKRVLITGSNGLLGQKITELFSRSKKYEILNTSVEDKPFLPNVDNFHYRQLDITSRSSVLKLIDDILPEVIINTAAVTNVDLCETERALAWRINVKGVENLVYAAKMIGAKIIHFSTDYVFDGKNGPYHESDRPNPLSYYGRTKLASENLLLTSGIPHTIVRTMVLYGVANQVKNNFALWLVDNLGEGKQVRVVGDQICNPTLVDDLAYAVLKIVEFNRDGLYHIAGNDLVSRYDFAVELAKKFKFDKKLIIPIKTSILKQPAPRPMKSGFIILKAETELSIKMSGVEQGLTVFRNQLINARSVDDDPDFMF
ncbi:MAG: dTDP-4-dehydrorhamnose reductase [Bacteroidetes bacterium]|nr:dTDP-4-dehydrorhamnose reductase [Bacteroidota bacterium]MBU1421655.1 dTDP-4-dehydrorhamnose reductase [Bacteroidota bacterium]MBU2472370.1 dTDP-4-dehydrorhamnose reductase [Bacteroidota bacterium]MBU2635639.1 dTDP-4-dehydrorhamnose reductase [Bacteroidota bacterium]